MFGPGIAAVENAGGYFRVRVLYNVQMESLNERGELDGGEGWIGANLAKHFDNGEDLFEVDFGSFAVVKKTIQAQLKS